MCVCVCVCVCVLCVCVCVCVLYVYFAPTRPFFSCRALCTKQLQLGGLLQRKCTSSAALHEKKGQGWGESSFSPFRKNLFSTEKNRQHTHTTNPEIDIGKTRKIHTFFVFFGFLTSKPLPFTFLGADLMRPLFSKATARWSGAELLLQAMHELCSSAREIGVLLMEKNPVKTQKKQGKHIPTSAVPWLNLY